ncbi:hypothetical protein DFH09DRAFT_1376887 [Mycena vulgaris]|nr:hypothetical protein DFH09DRAFT_1376887 [Mycena vulgaris]
MDPISATTTIITLATFIKDLIAVGQSIKRSIEKVGENRRRIRELTDDILRTIDELANLSRGHEEEFQAPALLSALGNLKADMLHVLSICSKVAPVEPRPGLRGFRSQLKVWIKRDDIEATIKHLKEHVNKCYLQFTAFSAARIEQTTARIEESSHHAARTALRVEQTLIVNSVESHVKLRRLESMMAQVLLETQFGQNVMNRTMEIVASDTTHRTLEFQYLSTQATRLVDSLQQLTVTRVFVLDAPLWVSTNMVITRSLSPKHILFEILWVTLQINDFATEIPFTAIKGILNLGSELAELGMDSEATSWHLMIIQVLRRLSRGGFHSDSVLPNIALSCDNLSLRYQSQLQWDLATETSQQAVDVCRLWRELSPDVDYWPLLGIILITHSENLTATGRLEDAVSIAEEAVAVCREMIEQLIDSGSELSYWTLEDEFKAVSFSRAFFALAAALSAVSRHLAAYEAAQEGFQTRLRFPRLTGLQPPSGIVVDTFIDQICKVAEEGSLSLVMLVHDVILFRDLARVYQAELTSQFLRLLHAYVYLSQQHSPDFSNLRLFLEPTSGSPSPVLDTSKIHIDAFIPHGGVIEDAIPAFFHVGSSSVQAILPLIQSFFIAHFDQAIAALRDATSKLMTDPHSHSHILDWALADISDDILPVVTRAQQLVLVELMTKIVEHFRTFTIAASSRGESILWDFSWALWMVGSLNEAMAVCDEAIEYMRRVPDDEADSDHPGYLHDWLVRRAFVLCNLGQIPRAIEAAHESDPVDVHNSLRKTLRYCWIRKQILQRTGRNREALQLLRNVVSKVGLLLTEDDADIRSYALILLTELAGARGYVGQLGEALTDAERAVATCRKDTDLVYARHALVHSLTALSNCLAAVGRNDEALGIAKEATSLYSPSMPSDFLYSLRTQELGANAFHSFSLRLATSGQMGESLRNAEKATELYREVVSLAPMHLPTLAKSLQNSASILCRVKRVNESVTACEEAVSVMRKVADTEPYFLPALAEALDQLAGYFAEEGDAELASATAFESAEVRRRMERLPAQPAFLFSEIEMESEDEEDEDVWETATESEDDYHDGETDIDVVVSDAVGANLLSTQQTSSLTDPPPYQSVVSISGEGAVEVAKDTAQPSKSLKAVILSTPLEVKFQLSSTPLDLLWWMLVGILFAAFAAVWSRVQ